jgi:dienelactone hydrolase
VKADILPDTTMVTTLIFFQVYIHLMAKKRSQKNEAQKYKSQLLTLSIAVITLAIVLIVVYFAFFYHPSQSHLWSLDNESRLSFGARGPVANATAVSAGSSSNSTIEKVTYESFGDTVYGQLQVPDNKSKPPVVIVLPAASVNKSADPGMGNALASWGYASLTLDERGNNGQTPGPSPMDLNNGYRAFDSNGDPVQYKQVYDVLRAYDYLQTRPDLDGNNVVVLGESMGGRFAIVSAALEPGLKAALVISSSSYSVTKPDNPKDPLNRFLFSIEPANYVGKLTPRKVVMFHFTEDPVIPLAQGQQLYDIARQPKAWHQYNGTVHGVYSDVYAPDLREELRSVFGR